MNKYKTSPISVINHETTPNIISLTHIRYQLNIIRIKGKVPWSHTLQTQEKTQFSTLLLQTTSQPTLIPQTKRFYGVNSRLNGWN